MTERRRGNAKQTGGEVKEAWILDAEFQQSKEVNNEEKRTIHRGGRTVLAGSPRPEPGAFQKGGDQEEKNVKQKKGGGRRVAGTEYNLRGGKNVTQPQKMFARPSSFPKR